MRSRFVARSGGVHFWKRNNSPKCGSWAPDAAAQTSELHNLAVIDKKVGVGNLRPGCDTQRRRARAPMRVAGAFIKGDKSGRTFWISSFEPDGTPNNPKYAIRVWMINIDGCVLKVF